ncbi:MAG: DUF1552 domain-containing protein [Deltaproteobacteria bacterium]|nr:DUF1552 domain-containing protein [Deltaproteobacteria bacterium]
MKSSTLPFVRRRLLQGFAGSAAAALLPSIRLGSAHAAGGVPTRLLLWSSGGSVPRHRHVFKSAAGGAATETDFVFPEHHKNFNAWRSKAVAFENLDMVSAMVDKTQFANAHAQCGGHVLGAANMYSPDRPSGPTFDQFIAKALNAPAPVTKIPSLALGVRAAGDNISATAPGQLTPFDQNPLDVYQRLFGAGLPSADPARAAEVAKLAEQRNSAIDLALSDFAALTPRLGKTERDKLQAHADIVSDLGKRLSITQGASCSAPTKASVRSGSYNADVAGFARLIQGAFACDLTRVALLFSRGPTEAPADWGYVPGAWGTTDDHDHEHKTGYAGSLRDHPEAMACSVRRHQIESRELSDMLALLDATPESDGGTVLDHTIVLFCPNMGDHGHAVDQMPWVLFTGKSTGIRTGRYMRFARTGGRGMPHNNLFVSIAQAMGVRTQTFGNPTVCTGPIPGLLA